MKDALKKANNKIEKLQKSSGIAVEIVKPEQNLFAQEEKKRWKKQQLNQFHKECWGALDSEDASVWECFLKNYI